MKTQPAHVTVYAIERWYGGPEEGGWWFYWWTPIKTYRARTGAHAERVYPTWKAQYEWHDRRGCHAQVVVTEGRKHEHATRRRPHYE